MAACGTTVTYYFSSGAVKGGKGEIAVCESKDAAIRENESKEKTRRRWKVSDMISAVGGMVKQAGVQDIIREGLELVKVRGKVSVRGQWTRATQSAVTGCSEIQEGKRIDAVCPTGSAGSTSQRGRRLSS